MVEPETLLGVGLSLLGVGFPTGVALTKLTPKKSNGMCSQHSGLVADILNLKDDITEIKGDVKKLLTRRRSDRGGLDEEV
jgi:hypothetical protein